jgi:chaperonin cofactor prefoldin
MSSTRTGAPTEKTTTAEPSARTRALAQGRVADSDRSRQRVLTALDHARHAGNQIGVSVIARAAGVDRSFVYRHRDLLEKIHTMAAEPPDTGAGAGPAVSRASLQADLTAAHEREQRLQTRIRQLETRLSEALGQQAWQDSGLGAPTDVDALHQQIAQLDGQISDLQVQLGERDQDLAAARATNRDLMAQLNR